MRTEGDPGRAGASIPHDPLLSASEPKSAPAPALWPPAPPAPPPRLLSLLWLLLGRPASAKPVCRGGHGGQAWGAPCRPQALAHLCTRA